jgi:hypothetical protein
MRTFIAIPFNQKLTKYSCETYTGHYTATHVVLHGDDSFPFLSSVRLSFPSVYPLNESRAHKK